MTRYHTKHAGERPCLTAIFQMYKGKLFQN